jgi:hypothetical protein
MRFTLRFPCLGLIVGVGLLLLCSATSHAQVTPASADSGASASRRKLVEMTFDLSKCHTITPNLYKCPAVDKPVCNPDYTPSAGAAECIKVGRRGNVYVSGPTPADN